MEIKFNTKRQKKVFDFISQNHPELLDLNNYVTLDDFYYEMINQYETFYNTANKDEYTAGGMNFAGIMLDHIHKQEEKDFDKMFSINYAIKYYRKHAKIHKHEIESIGYLKIANWLQELKDLKKQIKKYGNEF